MLFMAYIQDLRKHVGMQPIIMVGAAALVLDGQNCLLLQRRTDDGRWGLIGGAMELGESIEETARRELMEEAGLEATELKLLGVFSGEGFYHQYPNGDQVHNVIIAFVIHDAKGEPRACQEEGLELAYFSLNDLPDNILPLNQRVIEALSEHLRQGV